MSEQPASYTVHNQAAPLELQLMTVETERMRS